MVDPLGITEIDQLIYATASVITEKLGVMIQKMKSQKYKQPQWKERISTDIESLRKKLSEKAKGGMVSQRKIRRLLSQFKCKNEEEIPVLTEKIKQQITAKSQRIRRYKKRRKQYRQNTLFTMMHNSSIEKLGRSKSI